jgi:flagellin-like protein
MKKSVKNERGLSPVVASVLMIMLVVVLAAMIFLWARGFVSEQVEKFGQPVEQMCADVDFKIAKVGSSLEVSNRGDIDIYYLEIKMFKGGNSDSLMFNFPIDSGKSVTKFVTLEMDDGSVPESVIVYPALIGKIKGKNINRPFTCLDRGVTL